jgi:hypothetical protein
MTPGMRHQRRCRLGELDGSPDAFYQRTRMRLDQLSAKLLDWARTGEQAKVIDALRARAGEICRGMPEGDEGRGNCERSPGPLRQPAQRRVISISPRRAPLRGVPQ